MEEILLGGHEDNDQQSQYHQEEMAQLADRAHHSIYSSRCNGVAIML
jgi:hypothetical protein